MRIRSVKPEFWRSNDIASLPWDTRLLFIGLWSYVDDNGVGRDDVRIIAADLFALDEDFSESSLRVQDGLERLETLGLITRYTVNGKPLLHVTKWATHQRINRPSPGRYPLPTSADADIHAPLTESSLSPQEDHIPGAVDQGSSGSVEEESCSPAAPVNNYPAAFSKWWQHYPRKTDKRKALAAWRRALKRVTNDELIAGAIRYARDPNRDPGFTKQGERWLNGDCWLDDPLPPRRDGKQSNSDRAKAFLDDADEPADDEFDSELQR